MLLTKRHFETLEYRLIEIGNTGGVQTRGIPRRVAVLQNGGRKSRGIEPSSRPGIGDRERNTGDEIRALGAIAAEIGAVLRRAVVVLQIVRLRYPDRRTVLDSDKSAQRPSFEQHAQ